MQPTSPIGGSHLKVTVDTNIVIYSDQNLPESASCRQIFELARQRIVDVAVVPDFDFDGPQGLALRRVVRGENIEGFLTRIRQVYRPPFANPPPAPPALAPDKVLEAGIIGCLKPEAGRTWRILKKTDKMDVNHLMAHAQNGRDLFITCDKRILKKHACLSVLGIRVITPNDFIQAWRAIRR